MRLERTKLLQAPKFYHQSVVINFSHDPRETHSYRIMTAMRPASSTCCVIIETACLRQSMNSPGSKLGAFLKVIQALSD